MANEIEKTGALKFKDEAGNIYILYPVTTAEQVEGLEEKVNTLAAAQVGKTEPKSHSHAYSGLTGIPSTFTPAAHNQAASTITAGTFAGAVAANGSGQTYNSYLLRNTRLASSDTNPTVNGQICWTYK